MKYYSIYFANVTELRYIMSKVFMLLNRNGIYCVYFNKMGEGHYNLEVGDKLTFVCLARGTTRMGFYHLDDLNILDAYGGSYDPKYIYNWIMDKCRCNFRCDNGLSASTRAKDYFEYTSYPQIKKVIFNDPATIVFWSDGSKTIVKAQNGEVYDPEKGLAMAITKKWFGNKGNYYNNIKKWLPKDI